MLCPRTCEPLAMSILGTAADPSICITVAVDGDPTATLLLPTSVRPRMMQNSHKIVAMMRNPPTPTATPTAIGTAFVAGLRLELSNGVIMLTALTKVIPNCAWKVGVKVEGAAEVMDSNTLSIFASATGSATPNQLDWTEMWPECPE